MNINKTAWHYKWYKWFKGNEPTTANLCPYCRTVFLWTPLKFLFAKGCIRKLPVPVIVYPFLMIELPRWAGIISYNFKNALYGIDMAIIGTATAIGMGFGSAWLVIKGRNKRLRKLMTDEEWALYDSQLDEMKKYYIPTRLKKEPWWQRMSEKISNSLIWNYLKAKHDRICPIIYFEEGAK